MPDGKIEYHLPSNADGTSQWVNSASHPDVPVAVAHALYVTELDRSIGAAITAEKKICTRPSIEWDEEQSASRKKAKGKGKAWQPQQIVQPADLTVQTIRGLRYVAGIDVRRADCE